MSRVSKADISSAGVFQSYFPFDDRDFRGITDTSIQQAFKKSGGVCVPLTVGATVPNFLDVVQWDTTADDQVIQAAAGNARLAFGVAVGAIINGRPIFGPAPFSTGFVEGKVAAGNRIFVQVGGIANVTTDGTATVTRGDLLVLSSSVAGAVVTNNTPTAGQILAYAAQNAAASATVIRALLCPG